MPVPPGSTGGSFHGISGNGCPAGDICSFREIADDAYAQNEEAASMTLTFTDKENFEKELEKLSEERKQNIIDIQTARGFGDLSENAEYDAARKEEARIYARTEEVKAILETATFVDDKNVSDDVVSVGTIVKVYDKSFDEECEYTITGYSDADPMNGLISSESPVGKALIGARVGDEVTADIPTGKAEMRVLQIRKRN